jgi:indole-3-glycerol phosphate synthase
MMATILEKIVSEKRQDVAQSKRNLSLGSLQERIGRREIHHDFTLALRGDSIKIIAEVKKASPSKGVLCHDFDPIALAGTYARAGAAAVSVLTEANHFQGSLDHLEAIRQEVSIPLLRKDFIFDEYQVYESAAFGADAILLIVSILSQDDLGSLLALSHKLGLACLVEVHDENEVNRALKAGAEIIGINNRDLTTFNVNINTTLRLRPLVPEGTIVVSESGIRNREDIIILTECGVNAMLVGEALVTSGDIPAKMEALL